MGKIIDRVRERQDKLAKAHQREWISDAARRQREADNRYFEQMAAQQNAYSSMWMGYHNALQLQNSEEAKRWNALGIRDIERRNQENDEFKAKLEAEGKKNVLVLPSGIAVFEDPEPKSVWWKFWR